MSRKNEAICRSNVILITISIVCIFETPCIQAFSFRKSHTFASQLRGQQIYVIQTTARVSQRTAGLAPQRRPLSSFWPVPHITNMLYASAKKVETVAMHDVLLLISANDRRRLDRASNDKFCDKLTIFLTDG